MDSGEGLALVTLRVEVQTVRTPHAPRAGGAAATTLTRSVTGILSHANRLHRTISRRPAASPSIVHAAWRPPRNTGNRHRARCTAAGRRAGARPAPASRRWRPPNGPPGVSPAPRLAGPAVVGQSVSSGDDLTKLWQNFRGNQFAKAALDTAWWDLNARLQNCVQSFSRNCTKRGRPLCQMARRVLCTKGALPHEAIEVGPTFDRMESIDEFLAEDYRGGGGGLRPPEAQVPARLGRPHGRFRPQGVPHAVAPHRLRGRARPGPDGDALPAGRFHAGDDRAAAAGRRPGGPCHGPGIAPHADLPRRRHHHASPKPRWPWSCRAAST